MVAFKILLAMVEEQLLHALMTPITRKILDRIVVLRRIDLTKGVAEIFEHGFRAYASGITFRIGNSPYAIYFVKYHPTIKENVGGRYN